MPRENDLTGRRFGKLTAIERTEERKNRYAVWKCRCDCGRTVRASTKDLMRGTAKDCGCEKEKTALERKRTAEKQGQEETQSGKARGSGAGRRAIDLSGRTFGKLTALYPTKRRDGKGSVYWHCRCECGQEIEATEAGLMHGNYRSCGCLKKEHQKNLYRQLHHVDGTCVEILEKRKHRKDNTSGTQGISIMKNGHFRVDIGFKGKRFYLGTFREYGKAAAVRKEAEELIHDGFVRAYREWSERSVSDPDWAETHPFVFEVERKNGKFVINTEDE